MEQVNNEKDYVVFSQKLAGYLMMKGCRLLKLCPDRNKPTMNVYYFPNTEFVKEKIDEYTKSRSI